MADDRLNQILANSKTIPQLPEALGIQDNDYVVVYSASLQKPVKIKKTSIQFPTTSFVRGETVANFPNSGALSSLYLENSTNKLYKWDGAAYKWLMEGEISTINAYIATKLDKGTYTGDAVNLLAEAKAYADSRANGTKWKNPVLLATTANVTLSGEQTIQGVTTSASRVLVQANTNKTENGFYLTSATAWTRTTDADTGEELVNATTKVEQGTQANKIYTCNVSPITIGTTEVVFVPIGDIVDHNSTTGIQGGTTAEYYHLSLANFNKVNALPAVSEDTANKAVDFSIVDDVKYPTTKAVKDLLAKEDDVIGVINYSALPRPGKIDTIYIDREKENLYVWDEQITDYKLAGGGGSGTPETYVTDTRTWNTGQVQKFYFSSTTSITSTEKVNQLFIDGKLYYETDEWVKRSATEIEVLIPLSDGDKLLFAGSSVAGQGTATGEATTAAYSQTLTFDSIFGKFLDPHTQTAAVNFTLATTGNLKGGSNHITFIADGVNAINFSADFDFLYGITNGEILAAGTYEIYFLYKANGKVTVNVPAGTSGTTLTASETTVTSGTAGQMTVSWT